ncbi:MAG: hypothetical protein K0S68_251 [Candidatus Saccharibacteria bacterium]|jgi:hypothetical protein|nr:hypothetical protein [Candidatus Saccharibacteria bacterium]
MTLVRPPRILGDAYDRWVEILPQATENGFQFNCPSRLPTCLQTEATARALLARTDRSPEWIDQMVAHRLSLREHVLSDARIRLYQVLLRESALDLPVRGRDDRSEQLGLLLEAVDAGVQIRLIRDCDDYSGAPLGHFILAMLPSNTVMYVEEVDSSGVLVRYSLTVDPVKEQFAATWDDVALTADQTLTFIKDRLPR